MDYYELFITEEVDAPTEAQVSVVGVGCVHCGQLLPEDTAKELAETGRGVVCAVCGVTYYIEARTVYSTRKAPDSLQIQRGGK